MTRTNDIDGQGPDFFNGLQHEFAVGLQNHIKIVVKGFAVVPDFIVPHPFIGIVSPEGIAGKEKGFFLKIGVNGVGPVQVGSTDYLQFLIPQVDFITIFYFPGFKGLPKHFPQVGEGLSTPNYCGVGSQLQEMT